MATVKELEARLAALEAAFAKRVAETEELRKQFAEIRVAADKVAAAAKPAAARPAARCGTTTTYASPKDAMAAAKELAVAGKHRVCVTGCIVTSFPR